MGSPATGMAGYFRQVSFYNIAMLLTRKLAADLQSYKCMSALGRGQTLAISDTPQNTDLSHIPYSHLPVEPESHCLWGLHHRNESRVGFVK